MDMSKIGAVVYVYSLAMVFCHCLPYLLADMGHIIGLIVIVICSYVDLIFFWM